MPEQFLGREYDVNTATWRYSDGIGGAMPDEIRYEAHLALARPGDGSFLRFFNPIWRWKRLHGF